MSAPLFVPSAAAPDLSRVAAGLEEAGFAAALSRDAHIFDLVLLAAGCRARLPIRSASPKRAMSADERRKRQAAQLRLWAECSLMVVDEDLFTDAVRRRPQEAAALAATSPHTAEALRSQP